MVALLPSLLAAPLLTRTSIVLVICLSFTLVFRYEAKATDINSLSIRVHYARWSSKYVQPIQHEPTTHSNYTPSPFTRHTSLFSSANCFLFRYDEDIPIADLHHRLRPPQTYNRHAKPNSTPKFKPNLNQIYNI
jgi:hypothetical protein